MAATREIRFDPRRAVEAVLYLAARLDRPTIHEVLKLRYFADKLHLSRYGWLASGDDYVAMKFGPVGSGTYNLLKAARGDQSGWVHPVLAAAVEGALAVAEDRCTVVPLRPADPARLAPADRECLDEALRQYGNLPFGARTEVSHDDAWAKAWSTASDDEVGASPMPLLDIARTLDNAADVIEHLQS
jgi:uncharacterized phage-associated protein